MLYPTITDAPSARGPFRAVILAPRYCASTDAVLGDMAWPDPSGMYFETHGAALLRSWRLAGDDNDVTPIVVDMSGRRVVDDPAPASAHEGFFG